MKENNSFINYFIEILFSSLPITLILSTLAFIIFSTNPKFLENVRDTLSELSSSTTNTINLQNISFDSKQNINNKILKGRVVKVSDGDTINVIVGNREYKIRLIGIDTPESSKNQKFKKDTKKAYINKEYNIFAKIPPKQLLDIGKEAKRRLSAILLNQEVEIEIEGKDRYGRSLAWVFLNGKNINAYMISEGLARPYMYRGLKYENQLLEAQKKAKLAKKGIYKY